jgi:hypothetical protein
LNIFSFVLSSVKQRTSNTSALVTALSHRWAKFGISSSTKLPWPKGLTSSSSNFGQGTSCPNWAVLCLGTCNKLWYSNLGKDQATSGKIPNITVEKFTVTSGKFLYNTLEKKRSLSVNCCTLLWKM